MSTFVLVHGAWHGGWCWSRVADRLRAAGHEVFTPTLTGLADRSHMLSHRITLSTHIRDIANLLDWEDLSDVILVGHSYGGMVITGVADRAASRIKRLVYLDALIPESGQCGLDLRSEEANRIFFEKAKAGGGWRIAPTKAADFNVNPADQAWVDGKCTDMTISCFTEHLHLTGAGDGITDRVYIRAGGFANPYFDQMLAKAEADPRFACHSMTGGHDLMVDQPAELTELLLHAA
jgi:pimeloyl-ACP methyl ester carboxylesterase